MERHVQSIVRAYTHIDETVDNQASEATKYMMALMSHNVSPNSGSNVSPMYALNGRPIILEQMLQTAVVPSGGDRYDSEERQMWFRLHAMRSAQSKILEFDAKKTLKLCLQRNALVDSTTRLREGDAVDLWLTRKRKWQGAYRVLYDSGRTVLIENLGAIFKHPRNWVRMRERGVEIPTPAVIQPSVQTSGESKG